MYKKLKEIKAILNSCTVEEQLELLNTLNEIRKQVEDENPPQVSYYTTTKN